MFGQCQDILNVPISRLESGRRGTTLGVGEEIGEVVLDRTEVLYPM